MIEYLISPTPKMLSPEDFVALNNIDTDDMIREFVVMFGVVSFVYGLATRPDIPFPEIAEVCKPAFQRFFDHLDFHYYLDRVTNGDMIVKSKIIGSAIPFCRNMGQIIYLCRDKAMSCIAIDENKKKYKVDFNNEFEMALYFTSRIGYGRELVSDFKYMLNKYPMEHIYHDVKNM